MVYREWNGFCLCGAEDAFPEDAREVQKAFSPLVFLVKRDPEVSRGLFAIETIDELFEEETVSCLRPCKQALPEDAQVAAEKLSACDMKKLDSLVRAHGATVLNVSFKNAFDYLQHYSRAKKSGLKLTLIGLGDVGGTVLIGLKLLAHELSEIAIFDPNRAACLRYEAELNQVITESDGVPMPKITICDEADIFNCDILAFTASRGVPALDSSVSDVRMAQFEANKKMLQVYARKARESHFMGLFCQISDPVDHLARAVFLESNRNEKGAYDYGGLLPEQVQGFGLGVMSARAAYYAEKEQADFSNGRVYGPHGADLIVANSYHANDYDEELSKRLTELTVTANLKVREMGFKPYIAPGLSSAAISILRLIRGQEHYGAIPLNGAYFGCVSKFTKQGITIKRENICEKLMKRIEDAHCVLKEFDY